MTHVRQGLRDASAKSKKRIRILFVFHGQGEHCGRYQHFPHYLSNVVDVIATMDHRGHGRSEGVRGHVDRFDQYVRDARSFVERTVNEWSDGGAKLEINLFGHSMGGLISLLLLQDSPPIPFKCATLSAPLMGLKFPVPLPKQAAGHVLSRIFGSLQMDTGLDSRLVSHDAEVVSTYQSDSLVHGKATARFFTEMLGAMKRARSRTSDISVPIDFIIPLDDGLVDSDATQDYANRLEQEGKHVQTFPGFFHESFNELEKEKAFAELSRWIQKHSSSN